MTAHRFERTLVLLWIVGVAISGVQCRPTHRTTTTAAIIPGLGGVFGRDGDDSSKDNKEKRRNENNGNRRPSSSSLEEEQQQVRPPPPGQYDAAEYAEQQHQQHMYYGQQQQQQQQQQHWRPPPPPPGAVNGSTEQSAAFHEPDMANGMDVEQGNGDDEQRDDQRDEADVDQEVGDARQNPINDNGNENENPDADENINDNAGEADALSSNASMDPMYNQQPQEYWGVADDGTVGSFDPYGESPPQPEGWMGSSEQQQQQQFWDQQQPPMWKPDYDEQQQQQQQHNGNQDPYAGRMNDDDLIRARQELDDALMRESELLREVQNLTSSVHSYEQREDLHLRQLDVLTETVLHTEAELAAERNAAEEFRANCTELGRSMELMQEEMEEWKDMCANLTALHEADSDRIQDLKQGLRERTTELENLAMTVEKARLEDEHDRYLEERHYRKRRGFFAWLFGYGRDDDDGDDDRTTVRSIVVHSIVVEELFWIRVQLFMVERRSLCLLPALCSITKSAASFLMELFFFPLLFLTTIPTACTRLGEIHSTQGPPERAEQRS